MAAKKKRAQRSAPGLPRIWVIFAKPRAMGFLSYGSEREALRAKAEEERWGDEFSDPVPYVKEDRT